MDLVDFDEEKKEILGYIDEVNLLLERAYVPYSKFPVAALLIDNNGKKYKGVNVENASYGLTLCAERNAITTAVTGGMKKIKLLVITGNTPEPISPCGACRQGKIASDYLCGFWRCKNARGHCFSNADGQNFSSSKETQ